jgi:hypothetical protein
VLDGEIAVSDDLVVPAPAMLSTDLSPNPSPPIAPVLLLMAFFVVSDHRERDS